MQVITSPALRVASYNIRAGLGTDLRRDPWRVLRMIAALEADIVALQEADHRLGSRPAALPRAAIEEATGLCPLPVADAPDSLGWHGIALLARPGLELEALHRLPLPGLEPRGTIVADIAGLRLVAVHLGLLRRSRRAQLSRITAALADLPPRPTLILGDFNEWSRKTGLGRLARDYRIVTPQGTFPANLPLGALDRMAHCARLQVNLLDPPRTRRGPYPSDHLPILATVGPAA